MVVWIGSAAAALTAALQWAYANAFLVLSLLYLIKEGVEIVRIIRGKKGDYFAVPVV